MEGELAFIDLPLYFSFFCLFTLQCSRLPSIDDLAFGMPCSFSSIPKVYCNFHGSDNTQTAIEGLHLIANCIDSNWFNFLNHNKFLHITSW
jgi:hypothetical protein